MRDLDSLEEAFPYTEKETGRKYNTRPLHAPGKRNGLTGGLWKDKLPPSGKHWQYLPATLDKIDEEGGIEWSSTGNPRLKVYEDASEGIFMQDIWLGMKDAPGTGYPTEKNISILEKIIEASSNNDSLILDCFVGSGTTAVAAQKLGRKWIGADINKGAIQTTMKRMQKLLDKQSARKEHADDEVMLIKTMQHYRVNNYDFQMQHELKGLIIEKYDITPVKTDGFFDGIVGEKLVKIAELNQPVNKLTLQSILNELKNRADDTRDILVIGSGVELGIDTVIADYNKSHAVNKLEVKNIQSDGIIVNDPAEAAVTITKTDGTVRIKVDDYLSPTIVKRLDLDRSIFGEKISDFRAQIDVVLIDTDYDGKTFNIVHADVPEKKSDFVSDSYELELPKSSKQVAVKIIDMLGEETLIVEKI
jgi:hypothetical protein